MAAGLAGDPGYGTRCRMMILSNGFHQIRKDPSAWVFDKNIGEKQMRHDLGIDFHPYL